MKRIVILAVCILLITGCSVKYNLTINEDLSITEGASLTGTQDFFDLYYKSTKTNVLQFFLDIYKEILDEYHYEYKIVNSETPYVAISKKYNTINDFINESKLFNGYFDEVKYTEDGKIKRIETVGFNPNNPSDPDRFDIQKQEIIIKCPFVIKDNNAKRIDKKTNTLYYELDEKNNKIIIEFDSSKKFNANMELIQILVICAVILVGAWVVILINKNKNKKNNML